MITPFMLKSRPDQTSYELNQMLDTLTTMKYSINIMSDDGKNLLILGNQPINPATMKPYSFGIHTYEVKGDRLEIIE